MSMTFGEAILTIVAMEFDSSGSSADRIDDIFADYAYYDTAAENVYHQIVNGTYRTVELLAVIATELD